MLLVVLIGATLAAVYARFRLLAPVTPAPPAAQAPATPATPTTPVSFTFASAGDFGANDTTTATYAKLDTSGAAFVLALGDLDYDQTASDEAWCTYTKSKLPTLFRNPDYPFQIVTGNHEEQGGPNGYIMQHAACLPDRLNASGTYPAQYYFDYPANKPLMRVIMISPDLTVEGVEYQYTKGTAQSTWLGYAIDQARASDIPWVTVGMHKTCLSAGVKKCEIGEDLVNLLASKKVDMVLQGHEHNYQRSYSLAISQTCPALLNATFNKGCIAQTSDATQYKKGAGTFFLIDGIAGRSATDYKINPADPSYRYMAVTDSNPANRGFVQWTVTKDRIDARFVASSGPLTDSFSITR